MTAMKTPVAAEAGSPLAGADRRPQRRVVLLGASNLTNGFATAVRRLRRMFAEPLEILAAYGHGRSYGTHSVVFGRMLPGIGPSGLWTALEEGPRLPTVALVTDIGNDLLYDASVESIAGWLSDCLDRLARAESRIAITELPVVNLPRLHSWQYLMLRSALFPACRLSFEEVTARACALNERVHELARERGLSIVPQRAAWYGLDPIHVLKRHERAAWRSFLAPLGDATAGAGKQGRPADLRTVSGYALAPQTRWLFGREQRRKQPSCRFPDGTTFSIF